MSCSFTEWRAETLHSFKLIVVAAVSATFAEISAFTLTLAFVAFFSHHGVAFAVATAITATITFAVTTAVAATVSSVIATITACTWNATAFAVPLGHFLTDLTVRCLIQAFKECVHSMDGLRTEFAQFRLILLCNLNNSHSFLLFATARFSARLLLWMAIY